MPLPKKARIIYQTPHGYTFRNEGEDLIHLEFQNFILTFIPTNFSRFKDFIYAVDVTESEAMHSASIHTRKILVDTNLPGVIFAFLKHEFEEFKLLLEGTEAMLKLFEYAREAKLSVN
jgi:hypothetical protein